MEDSAAPGNEELTSVFAEARDAAFRFLSYRARSEAEVRRRLLRTYPIEIVQQVIVSLRDHQFLDDHSFARQWRGIRERHRPRSDRLIQQELFRLGVSSEVIQAALEDFDNAANAYQAGLKLGRQLISRERPEQEFRRRLSSHLQRRGFNYSQVRVTVERLWQELGADFLHRQDDAKDDEQ